MIIDSGRWFEAECAFFEPRVARTAASQHELVVCQPEDSTVIDHASIIGTPDAIGDSIKLDFPDIPGDHSIEHRFSVSAADFVFLHRADVIGPAGIAHAKILVLCVVIIVGKLVAIPC